MGEKKIKSMFLFIIAIFALVIAGCSTLKVEVEQKGPSFQGKKVALIKVNFSERIMPKLPLIDAGMYRAAAESVNMELHDLYAKHGEEMNDYYEATVVAASGAEVVVVDNPMKSTVWDESGNLDAATKEMVREICSSSGTNYAVLPVVRLNTLGVSGFGINGSNVLESRVYIFDNSGNIAGQGYFRTESETFGPKNLGKYDIVLGSYKEAASELFSQLFL